MSIRAAWHSINSAVYHNNTEFTTGNNIEKENVRPGTGNRRLCDECERRSKAKKGHR